MGKFPGAAWRPVTRYQSGSLHVRMYAKRLVLHTAVSGASSMHSYFNVSGRATPHFYVNAEGKGEQYIDTDYQSTANLEGNYNCITVESWDGYPSWSGSNVPDWTAAQVEWLAKLAVWCHKQHGIPIQRLPSSRAGTTGIGWHRLGIDGNFPSGLLAGRVPGGETWSTSTGKVCPGDRKIVGTVERVIPRARQLLTGDEPEMQADEWERLGEMIENKLAPVKQAIQSLRENERHRDKVDRGILEEITAALDGTANEEQVRRVREKVALIHRELLEDETDGTSVT